MPAPQFVPLTLDEFRKLVERFDFSARRINEVHMHHTWRPNHRDFRGLASILGMWKYHTETNKWSDIAQHVTIDPQGIIWTGRSWKQAPASSGGHNGTSKLGPFMFEIIGDFDVGKEKLQGAQRASVIGVIAAIQKKNGLKPNTLRFHRQLGSPKTCPGSGISYDEILTEVTRAHATIMVAVPTTPAAPTRALAARAAKNRQAATAPEPASAFATDESRIISALAVSGADTNAMDPRDAGTEHMEGETSRAPSRKKAAAPARKVAPAAARKKAAAAEAFTLGHRVERACRVTPYDRQAGDPLSRPLRIFALDPAASVLHGNVACVDVPFEPLMPGPSGKIFEVDSREFDMHGKVVVAHDALDLETPKLMLAAGLEPTQSDPRFHAQMTYAVCSTLYKRFREALGRSVAWGYQMTEEQEAESEPVRLRIKPLGVPEQNAYYDPETGELVFGYFPADRKATIGRNLPRGYVFTCLGHDIVAHECTHALLDGLRAHFTTTTHPDVAAFHEGFADVVALLHRFSHRDVVRAALRASRGKLDTERLTDIGRQFGETAGDFGPIRNAIDYDLDANGDKVYKPYDSVKEPHDRGRFLCGAIYEAFVTIYNRKIARQMRLASSGSGVFDPKAELPNDLLEILTDKACELAKQFSNICIRAIDYCPPVDIRFGDYLRAVITADRDMVPDDPYGYREAWIDAFQRRKIYPEDVANLGEDALVWRSPQTQPPPVTALSFAELAFDGDPGRVPKREELRRQAMEVGKLVTNPGYMHEFGLIDPSAKHPADVVAVDAPSVESVRTARRVGPDGNVVFDLVTEVTQRVVRKHKNKRVELYGGATILIDAWGKVRFAIRKRVCRDAEDKAALDFLTSADGSKYWKTEKGIVVPQRASFRLVHQARHAEA